ncbi:MAG: MgtE intracellular region [Candidatus Magasanikbacteria bacterium GW2011_GWA2_40_10]|uniref:MgtE intracellular region n=1 Tax=Candidatus Magasanikbacteria bacterium GW2011_GWA2_40_10 TaxID=1619037 RepID=A0A0G0TBD1_9BACT|nr:MAG: MgtE intracellular region [Candidatus Magasanikbacteria bacterium GW2011_GWA2_40_10]
MLFFSNILGAEVRDQADCVVGKVFDAVILHTESDCPPVIGVVVSDKRNLRQFINADSIENFGKNYLTLKNGFLDCAVDVPQEKDFIFLRDTVLDRQIVDLAGVRVVRVNDLQFGMIKGEMCLVTLDIGKLGLLRRLGLAGLNLFNFLQPELLEWKNVRLLGDKLQLSMGTKEMVKLHPADIANIIEKLNLNQGSELLQSLDKKTAARVLEELEPEIQRILVESLGPERAAGVMQKMSIDELVDLIQMLPDRKSKEIMENLPSDSTSSVRKILEFDEDTAGGLMTTEYVSVFPSTTVKEVVEQIRQSYQIHRGIYIVYIINENGNFKGVVSLRKLIISEYDQTMDELMDNEKKPTATSSQNILEVASLMTKYNLTSIAVLGADKKLLGVITVDDVMRHFVPHA